MAHHSLYFWSVVVHILAAVMWVGGMLFLVFVLMPALKNMEDARLRAKLIRVTGIRFRSVGWACLAVLLVTGFLNLLARGVSPETLADPAFWTTGYGKTLGWKVLLFLVILSLSATHDFLIGPRAGQLQRRDAGGRETQRLRFMATWFGRLNLVLSIIVVLLGVMLVRGVPW